MGPSSASLGEDPGICMEAGFLGHSFQDPQAHSSTQHAGPTRTNPKQEAHLGCPAACGLTPADYGATDGMRPYLQAMLATGCDPRNMPQ